MTELRPIYTVKASAIRVIRQVHSHFISLETPARLLLSIDTAAMCTARYAYISGMITY